MPACFIHMMRCVIVTAFLGEIGLTMYDANVKFDHNYNLNVYGSTAIRQKSFQYFS